MSNSIGNGMDPTTLNVSVQRRGDKVFLCGVPVFLFISQAEIARGCTNDKGVAIFGRLEEGTYIVVACGQSITVTIGEDDGTKCVTIIVNNRNNCGFCRSDVAGINSCGGVSGCVGGVSSCSGGCGSGCHDRDCGCGCHNCGCGCRGSIKIEKFVRDEPCRGLSGAIFALYDICRRLTCKGVTDKNGILNFKNIPCGKYIVIEEKAPVGYMRDNTPKPVKVENCEESVLKFPNTPIDDDVAGTSDDDCCCRRHDHDDDVSDITSTPCCSKCGSISPSTCPNCNCSSI